MWTRGDPVREEPGGSRSEAGGHAAGRPAEGGREPDSVSAGGGLMELAEAAEPQDDEDEDEDTGHCPATGDQPQTDEDVRNSTATVKVALASEGHVITVAFTIGLSVQELKRHLASELRVPVEVLLLSLDGRPVEEERSLMELGVRPHSSTHMEMVSTHPDAHPLRPLRPADHDTMSDVITVQVQTTGAAGEGQIQEVVVEIERPLPPKAYLGGYRHRLTGAVYHHAATQTLLGMRRHQGVFAFSRTTQTAAMESKAQQCPADASTQMTGIGCFVSCMSDRLLAPGPYTTSDQYHERRLKATLCLQTYARRWLARQAVDRLRQERARWRAWMDLQERKNRQEKEERAGERRRRRMNPERREDFDLLYHDLQRWRISREEQINSTLRGAQRKAALYELLEEETRLVADIGCHRVAADADARERNVKQLLNMSSAPHRWRAADGRPLQMETPDTIRAGRLRELYHRIQAPAGDQEQRNQVLMELKHTVQEQSCPLSQDLLELIDREVHLMEIKVKEHNLEGLRKRICTLFLQFIKTPAFNPEVAKLLRVPQDPSELKKNNVHCCRCRGYLSPAEILTPARGSRGLLCFRCARDDRNDRRQTDFCSYENILMKLRAEEQELNKEAKIPFLLKVEDMRHLVEVVWAARSALQADDNLDNLVFVRWDRWCDWSPWNCILLSKEEAPAHLDVVDVHKAYEPEFHRDVHQRHSVARRYFAQNAALAEYLDSPWPVVSGPIATATDHRKNLLTNRHFYNRDVNDKKK